MVYNQHEFPPETDKYTFEQVGEGFNSGRVTHSVFCKKCDKQITPATTSPSAIIKMHEEECHG